MAKAKLTEVILTCIYSGHEGEPGPGTKIALDAEEAARLIDLGAAVLPTEAPIEEQGADAPVEE